MQKKHKAGMRRDRASVLLAGGALLWRRACPRPRQTTTWQFSPWTFNNFCKLSGRLPNKKAPLFLTRTPRYRGLFRALGAFQPNSRRITASVRADLTYDRDGLVGSMQLLANNRTKRSP